MVAIPRLTDCIPHCDGNSFLRKGPSKGVKLHWLIINIRLAHATEAVLTLLPPLYRQWHEANPGIKSVG